MRFLLVAWRFPAVPSAHLEICATNVAILARICGCVFETVDYQEGLLAFAQVGRSPTARKEYAPGDLRHSGARSGANLRVRTSFGFARSALRARGAQLERHRRFNERALER